MTMYWFVNYGTHHEQGSETETNRKILIRFGSVRLIVYSVRFDSTYFFRICIRFGSVRLSRTEPNRIIRQFDSVAVSVADISYSVRFGSTHCVFGSIRFDPLLQNLYSVRFGSAESNRIEPNYSTIRFGFGL